MNDGEIKPKRFRFPLKRTPNGEEGVWHLEQQGTLLTVSHSGAHYQHQPGKRDKVEYFSAASRLRLLKKLARVEWDKIGLTQFLTLTYPDEVKDGSYTDRTQHRTLLFRWIEEQVSSKKSVLWKVEWKPRKSGSCKGQIAPHMHCCVFNTRYLNWQQTAQRWGEILGVESVNVEGTVTRGGGCARYCSKYCSKDESESGLGHASYLAAKRPGRAWGWTRQNLVPLAERTEAYHLSEEEIGRAHQLAGMVLGKETTEGFTLLNDHAEAAARYILSGGGIPLDKDSR